jgi:D-tyrosyl-tRNA(Tyr) deacylase
MPPHPGPLPLGRGRRVSSSFANLAKLVLVRFVRSMFERDWSETGCMGAETWFNVEFCLRPFLEWSHSSSMRAVIQRVSEASVRIKGEVRGEIGAGLLVLLAIEEADTPEDIEWLSGKIVRLRVFNDEEGVMNRSVQEIGGGILLISQFTLFASTKKGNRPSYTRSARPEIAIPLYENFIARVTQDFGQSIQTGEFGAHMDVSLTNDGPVTIIIDSKMKE